MNRALLAHRGRTTWPWLLGVYFHQGEEEAHISVRLRGRTTLLCHQCSRPMHPTIDVGQCKSNPEIYHSITYTAIYVFLHMK